MDGYSKTLPDYNNRSFSIFDPGYVDIYSYQDGKSNLIVQEVLAFKVTSNGTLMAITNYDADNSETDVVLVDIAGNKTEIDKYRKIFFLEDSNLLYLSDGSLWLGRGENKKMVTSQAEYAWCKDARCEDELDWQYN